jgi:hypothetical protein
MKKTRTHQRDTATIPTNRTGVVKADVDNMIGGSSSRLDLTPEEAERVRRWAVISRLNPGGLTGDADKINEQKLAFEGQ